MIIIERELNINGFRPLKVTKYQVLHTHTLGKLRGEGGKKVNFPENSQMFPKYTIFDKHFAFNSFELDEFYLVEFPLERASQIPDFFQPCLFLCLVYFMIFRQYLQIWRVDHFA